MRDLALANPFRFFVTLTFDKSKVDRWDDKEALRVTKNWLDNMVRRRGLAYVLVPERHKDGAIHFHGFFNGVLEGVDSGHKTSRGQTIYNLPAWPWGFTTAMEVYGDYSAAVGYVCKYISKGHDKVGGRWYWHGASWPSLRGNILIPIGRTYPAAMRPRPLKRWARKWSHSAQRGGEEMEDLIHVIYEYEDGDYRPLRGEDKGLSLFHSKQLATEIAKTYCRRGKIVKVVTFDLATEQPNF